METAAATCYACKLFRRNTQILELTTKKIEEQSLHDVLFELSKTVLRHSGSLTRDTFSGYVESISSDKLENKFLKSQLVYPGSVAKYILLELIVMQFYQVITFLLLISDVSMHLCLLHKFPAHFPK